MQRRTIIALTPKEVSALSFALFRLISREGNAIKEAEPSLGQTLQILFNFFHSITRAPSKTKKIEILVPDNASAENVSYLNKPVFTYSKLEDLARASSIYVDEDPPPIRRHLKVNI